MSSSQTSLLKFNFIVPILSWSELKHKTSRPMDTLASSAVLCKRWQANFHRHLFRKTFIFVYFANSEIKITFVFFSKIPWSYNTEPTIIQNTSNAVVSLSFEKLFKVLILISVKYKWHLNAYKVQTYFAITCRDGSISFVQYWIIHIHTPLILQI